MKNLVSYNVTEKNGNLMIDRVTFDSITGRLYNKRIIIRDGKRKDVPFSVRLYNYHEITGLLQKAGLCMEHIYGDWNFSDFTSKISLWL